MGLVSLSPCPSPKLEEGECILFTISNNERVALAGFTNLNSRTKKDFLSLI
jgi:hypothetical protein